MLFITDRARLSRNIRFLRKRKKLSRSNFSKRIGLSPSQLLCIEKEVIDHIDAAAVHRLSEMFGIPIDEILSEDVETKYAGKRFSYRL